MYCVKCGKELDENNHYCSNCGSTSNITNVDTLKYKNTNKKALFFVGFLLIIGLAITYITMFRGNDISQLRKTLEKANPQTTDIEVVSKALDFIEYTDATIIDGKDNLASPLCTFAEKSRKALFFKLTAKVQSANIIYLDNKIAFLKNEISKDELEESKKSYIKDRQDSINRIKKYLNNPTADL